MQPEFVIIIHKIFSLSLLSCGSPDANPASNYMFKVDNRNTKTRCEICSKLTIKTPERCPLHHSGVFIVVNFENISHLVLVFL